MDDVALDRAQRLADAIAATAQQASVSVVDGAAEVHLGDERGEPADRVDLLGEIESIIVAFARALAQLHALPLDALEAERALSGHSVPVGWEAIRTDIEHRLAAIDPTQLPAAYARYSPTELFEIWSANRPVSEDLVVCHGGPLLENVLLREGAPSGYRDLARLRIADRHLDLAVAHHSVHARFGGDASFIFYDAYGTDPDLVRLDHYTLANVLLG